MISAAGMSRCRARQAAHALIVSAIASAMSSPTQDTRQPWVTLVDGSDAPSTTIHPSRAATEVTSSVSSAARRAAARPTGGSIGASASRRICCSRCRSSGDSDSTSRSSITARRRNGRGRR